VSSINSRSSPVVETSFL
jgi:hypothetical protein